MRHPQALPLIRTPDDVLSACSICARRIRHAVRRPPLRRRRKRCLVVGNSLLSICCSGWRSQCRRARCRHRLPVRQQHGSGCQEQRAARATRKTFTSIAASTSSSPWNAWTSWISACSIVGQLRRHGRRGDDQHPVDARRRRRVLCEHDQQLQHRPVHYRSDPPEDRHPRWRRLRSRLCGVRHRARPRDFAGHPRAEPRRICAGRQPALCASQEHRAAAPESGAGRRDG